MSPTLKESEVSSTLHSEKTTDGSNNILALKEDDVRHGILQEDVECVTNEQEIELKTSNGEGKTSIKEGSRCNIKTLSEPNRSIEKKTIDDNSESSHSHDNHETGHSENVHQSSVLTSSSAEARSEEYKSDSSDSNSWIRVSDKEGIQKVYVLLVNYFTRNWAIVDVVLRETICIIIENRINYICTFTGSSTNSSSSVVVVSEKEKELSWDDNDDDNDDNDDDDDDGDDDKDDQDDDLVLNEDISNEDVEKLVQSITANELDSDEVNKPSVSCRIVSYRIVSYRIVSYRIVVTKSCHVRVRQNSYKPEGFSSYNLPQTNTTPAKFNFFELYSIVIMH